MHTFISARIVAPEKRLAMTDVRAELLTKESSVVERALGTKFDCERSMEIRVLNRECRVVQRRPAKKLGSDIKVVR